jgi:hypothetical protein
MRAIKLLSCVVALSLSLSACGGRVTTLRHSSDYATSLSRSQIAALPAEAIVNTETAGGLQSRMYDYEDVIQPIIQDEVTTLLLEKGYGVHKIREQELKENKLYQDVHNLKGRYNEQARELYKALYEKAEKAENINNSVGGAAAAVSGKTGGQIFMLTNYEETVKNDGARVKDFMVDALIGSNLGGETEKSVLTVGFVDGKTGKILWANQAFDKTSLIGSGLSSLTSSDEEIARKKIKTLVERVLSLLPDKGKLFENPKD